MKLYHGIIMDHYHHPRHHGVIKNPDFVIEKFNPLCGDLIVLTGCIKDNMLIDAAFEGSGCAISQATASMLLERIMGKNIQDILALTPDDMKKMIGIDLGPTRLKCATLALDAIHEGIRKGQNHA